MISRCLACVKPIDLVALHRAKRDGEEFTHDCGRLLIPANDSAPAIPDEGASSISEETNR